MRSRAKIRGVGRALILATALAALSVSGVRAVQAGSQTLADADRHFARKSYNNALQGYQSAQKAGQVPADRRDLVTYRIAVSLGKTQQWDRALNAGLSFVKTHRGSVWEGRGLYWLGRLYVSVPHQGYRVDSRTFRGQNVPKASGDDKPVLVMLTDRDQRNTRDALEAARITYPVAAPITEQIQLDYDLIHVLERDPAFAAWAQKQAWLPPSDDSWRVDVAQSYDVAWPIPKKIVYLYQHIGHLANVDSRQRALALLGHALWMRQYQAVMRRYAVKYENNKVIKIPYPYQDVRPGTMLGELARQFPNEPLRDQAQYLQAVWRAQDNQIPGALAALRQLIADRPGSTWAKDARAQIDALTRPDVSVSPGDAARPGSHARLQLMVRNVRQVHLDAYRIDLPRLLARPERITKTNNQNESRNWNDLNELLGGVDAKRTLARALASRGAHRVAAWEQRVGDTHDYRPHFQTVTTPLKDAGAYLIVASVPGQRSATLLPITDLMLIQKNQRGSGLYYVTDAQSGKPQANAKVIVKQWWEQGDKRGASVSQGLTNRDGLVTMPIRSAQGRSISNVGAVAIQGTRFALVNPSYFQQVQNGIPNRFKVYSTTDRTVYRPQQTVQFRHLLIARTQASSRRGSLRLGDFRPLTNRLVRVAVTDPQGNVVYKQRTRCSEFGSVSGRFTLPANAPLGEYNLEVSLPSDEKDSIDAQIDNLEVESAGNRFRVEEYKKPEFEVTITPSSSRVKLGQPTQAKIHAAYYFGGPVPNARVTYRVYRSQYAASYRFPQPFDYLYNNDANRGNYDTDYRSGEVIAQGKTNLDAQGDATVTFGTKADGARWQNSDLSYTVEADIQDQSRRVISGAGALKATQHDVAVFLNFAHGYATQGDRVDVEVKTLNPSDQPVSVEGMARVYRQPQTPNGKETPVASFPLHTDAQGHGEIQWKADKAGYFRIAFETKDTDGEKVSGDTSVWVDGAELRARRFLFQGVTLAVKNPYYQAGETARVLLVTPAPGCTVLLTREAEGQILDKRVIRVPGRSLEVMVPVTPRDAPNVFLSAVMAWNGETFQADQELFVPPVRQTATVTVQADKPRYAPGEKAHLRIQARDFLGRPLRAELSVAISDAALNYIQKDYAPDIRAYFYGDRRARSIEMQNSQQASFTSLTETTRPVLPIAHSTLALPSDMGQIPMQEFQAQFGRGGRFRDMAGYDSDATMSVGSLSNGVYLLDRSNLMVVGGNNIRTFEAKTEYASSAGRSYQLARGLQTGDEIAGSVTGMRAPMGMPGSGGFIGNVSIVNRSSVTPNSPAPLIPSLHRPRQAGELADAVIRSDFRDTAFWTPAVVTDAQGQATVDVTWPDNLTQWRARAVGSTTTAQVGTGEARVTTKKDLLVQLETPRFLVERDIATFSAIVHNDTDHESRIRVKLDLDNADVTGIDLAALTPDAAKAQTRPVAYSPNQNPTSKPQNPKNPTRLLVKTSETWVTIPKGGQQRVDWLVRPQHGGVMHARMTAQSETDGDATQTILPVLTHGVEREVVQTGVLRAQNAKTAIGDKADKTGKTEQAGKTEEQAQVTITLPALRKSGSSRLVVTLNPSLVGVMLDALPYLADYPYGCVEQTMSRFLPSVIVANTLKSGGYNLRDLEKAARQHGLSIAKGVTNGQPRMMANSAYTYPNAKQGAQHQEINPSGERWRSPVFDSAELARMVRDGLARLKDFQHTDGGWGWWKDDSSDAYMSAYVVYGLIACQKANIEVPDDVLARGLRFLQQRYLDETDLHQMVYQARVLALVPAQRPAIAKRVSVRLYPQREKLSAYGKALLALALHHLGQNARAKIVLDNLENTAHIDEANGTANWDDVDSNWWRWYNNKVETNATILQAYTAIAPDAKIPAMLVKWLVNNRRGASWHDTQETSLAVNALAEWMRVHKELSPDYTLTLDLGGKVRRSYRVTPANALFFDNTFVVPDSLLQTGDQTLTIIKQGTGACYFAATTRTFSEEEPIKATGNEIQVKRRYFRLIPGTASGTEGDRREEEKKRRREETGIQNLENPFLTGKYEMVEQGGEQFVGEETEQGPQYERVELKPDDIVNSGDLLEVEFDLEAKNDYEYVLFEDMKPAGCEPVEVRSGEHSGLGVYSNMELRDEKVAFFLSNLPQGHRVLSYRLWAETPGLFHALPTNGYAMYAPDVRTLSDENRLSVHEETSGGGE